MRKEIVDSKKILEKQLGIKVNCLAYPYGNYSQKVRELVKDAGYEAAFTVYGQRIGYTTPAYDILGRYAVEQNKPKIFQDALSMTGGGLSDASAPGRPASSVASWRRLLHGDRAGAGRDDLQPASRLIKANLAAMGEVDPKSVEMRVSGLGQVPAQYDDKTRRPSASR